MLKGKKISILGDSISTYKGVSNDFEANPTIGSNPYFYHGAFPLEKTYWMRVIDAFEMELCVNNSWSGGNLSGMDDPTSGVNRAHELSKKDGEEADLIIVFMGINDLGRGIDALTFSSDYEKTLSVIKESNPKASVCCVNIPDRDIFLRKRAEEFNRAIEKAVLQAGSSFFIADLFNSKLNNDFYYMNTVDGLHPDEDGMGMIADVIKESIRANYSVA